MDQCINPHDLELDLFSMFKGHVQEVIDIINEEIDLTEYGDLDSRTVAENVFLKEKLKRVHKIRDESNRQFLNYLERINRNKTPTPEYIAQCKKIMENPDSAKTISDAHNSGFLFHQYVCTNILDTYKQYNNTIAKIYFSDAFSYLSLALNPKSLEDFSKNTGKERK